MAIKRKKYLYEENIKKNKENQKGGRPSGRVRGGGVSSNPANLGGKKKVVEKKKSVKKGEPTKAQKMAKANIKKYGGTAKAAAANKEAMRLKIKKKYQESQKKKKK